MVERHSPATDGALQIIWSRKVLTTPPIFRSFFATFPVAFPVRFMPRSQTLLIQSCPSGSLLAIGSPAPYEYRFAAADGEGSTVQSSRLTNPPVPGWYQRADMLTAPDS